MTAVAAAWWLAARRWWSVQHSVFVRMRHIERRLGLHSLSYLQYLDHPEKTPKDRLLASELADLELRTKARDRLGIRRHQHWGVQASLWVLPVLIFVAWLLYAVVLFIAQIL
jgi:hypothetical protein